jgi:uncharacterized protein YbjT (DUF2867 family)
VAARRILITGASGYVGGRLVRALERRGESLRCLARRPEYLAGRVAPTTEVVRGDCLDLASVSAAMAGVDVAYYLVHSMGAAGDFAEQDRRAAEVFGAAARGAGVRRIVYLGGLSGGDQALSAHLRSRRETGEVLRASGVAVVELQASIILGSGSLSFELIRALVERVPVMLCPRWVRSVAQPIAIEDVVDALVAALDVPAAAPGRVFQIGGADRVSYADIMREYARQRGLARVMIPVPVLTPWLSSLWLGLVTPVYARVGRKLIEGVRNTSVVEDDAAQRELGIRPRGLREAIARAIDNESRELAETRWCDAVSSSGEPRPFGGVRHGSRLVDSRTQLVAVPPAAAFAPIRRIGGARGWYYANPLWRLRGFLDLTAGGVGLRRGRRDPERLAVGDALDFWRVEAFEPDRRLLLRAEMRLPGRAWLELGVREERGGSRIVQTAIFEPAGLLGLAYWYGIYALHARIFDGMLRRIAALAEAEDGAARGVAPSATRRSQHG